MNYSISFPGYCTCAGNYNQGIYGTNMWNVNGNQPGNQTSCIPQSACNECLDIIKGLCVIYTGTNLTNTGINQNDTLNTILQKLDAIKQIQDTKNTNILAALNDINDRLNVLEPGADHPPYSLL
jgi:hypothetical protein